MLSFVSRVRDRVRVRVSVRDGLWLWLWSGLGLELGLELGKGYIFCYCCQTRVIWEVEASSEKISLSHWLIDKLCGNFSSFTDVEFLIPCERFQCSASGPGRCKETS